MLIDPFKMHSHSLKKPIEEKKENIEQLVQGMNRYYPLNTKGQIDEWGAIIHKQAENFE